MLFLFSDIKSVRNNFVSVGKRDRITRFLKNQINVLRKKGERKMQAISDEAVPQVKGKANFPWNWKMKSRIGKAISLVAILMWMTIYLNIGYVVATDITRLCQNMTASSRLVENFWMRHDAISMFCPKTDRPLNVAEFALVEGLWPLAYVYGGAHWFVFLIFEGGIAKMMGFAVFM
jgi:hypothetical protein